MPLGQRAKWHTTSKEAERATQGPSRPLPSQGLTADWRIRQEDCGELYAKLFGRCQSPLVLSRLRAPAKNTGVREDVPLFYSGFAEARSKEASVPHAFAYNHSSGLQSTLHGSGARANARHTFGTKCSIVLRSRSGRHDVALNVGSHPV